MYQKRKKGWIKHLDFMLLDMGVLVASLLLSCFLYSKDMSMFTSVLYQRLTGLLLLFDVIVVIAMESYKSVVNRGYLVEFKKTLIHMTTVMGMLLIFLFYMKMTSMYSRIVLSMVYMFSVTFMYLVRSLRKFYLRKKLNSAKYANRMIIISTLAEVEACLEQFETKKYGNFFISGLVIIDAYMKGKYIKGIPVVCNINEVGEYATGHIVDEVFIHSNQYKRLAEDLSNILLEMGITVHLNLAVEVADMPNTEVEKIAGYTVVTTTVKMASEWQIFLKRCMDIVGSLIGIVFFAIAFVIFAPIIYVQSPGRIFFRQRRVGKNGRQFYMYKFRSMYPDAEAQQSELMQQNKMRGHMFKAANDPRVLPIGRFMRKWSIDELPQFINILKGDMSLVGTRPPTVDEVEAYSTYQKIRLSMKPGLTGMWQISGRSNITDFEEIVALDYKYISEWTLRKDIEILLKTMRVVFLAEGAM
ncbi:MAG: sugar transferase [Lachnospiraceae bacterium]|nr:sugar transferase [Lachnospiraceae bacterium]